MSSYKHICLAVCLLCAVLPARAGNPNDNRSANDDRSSGTLQKEDFGYTKEWGGKDIYKWIKDLRHDDPTNRLAALLALTQFKQSADAIPAILLRLANDGDASVRVKAAVIMRMIPHHETDRTRIIKALGFSLRHDPQAVVRYEAAYSLRFYCPLNFKVKEESDVLQDLVAGLSQKTTYELREACVLDLMVAGVDPKTGPDTKVTDALVFRADPLREPATRVRVQAIMALGVQGRPHDRKQYDKVMSMLKLPANYNSRSHPIVRIWARVSVIALQTEEREKENKKELAAIAKYLSEKDASIRREAVRALGALGDKSQDYLDDILNLLKHRDEIVEVKASVAEALGHMKNTGGKVIDALIRLTEEDTPESFPIVWEACTALVRLGVANGKVLNAMEKVLEHKSLQKHQRMLIKQGIEELQNPRKRLMKDAPKEPDKANPPKKNKGR